MTPRDLGFPETFATFRPAQEECFEHCLTSERRFTAIGAPPGVGKSGIAYGLGKLFGGKTVILTATLGLQDQYKREFGDRIVDMRGRSNFRCWEGGSCEDGRRMDCKDKTSCPYIVQHRRFVESEIGMTSYAWWLAGKMTGLVDTLILDEAGLAPEWLSRALDFKIYEREAKKAFGGSLPGEDLAEWGKLAALVQAVAEGQLTKAKMVSDKYRRMEALQEAEDFEERAAKLLRLDENWIVERVDGTDQGRLWKFECVWPGKYRERLFRGIGRVVLMSATLRPKTLGLLGIARDDVDFREWGRQFPAANGPVVWVPTVRVNFRTNEEGMRAWFQRLREIFDWGSDRKGLVHTVSYARAREIRESCDIDRRIMLNGAADPDSRNSRAVYESFLRSDGNPILVSPSFSTGWDFPRAAAEWQVIAKIAFPDTRSKVMSARCEADREYRNYLAAQDLVQGCGRIVRSETDRGTTLIIDDSWAWFQSLAANHMPKWFKVRKEERLPKPLPKI